MAIAINQAKAIRQSYQLVTVSSCSQSYRDGSQSLCDAKSRHLSRVNCQKSFSFRWSRGSDLRLLRLTMNGLPDRTSGERPRASSIVRVRRLDPMKLGPFAGKIWTDSWRRPNLFCCSTVATPVLRRGRLRQWSVRHPGSASRKSAIIRWTAPNLRGHQ